MIWYPSTFNRHGACWALFFLVANVATPFARGQEVPSFDVPTMGTNETFRTNFCEAHRLVENGEVPLRHALKDMNLRPALFRYQLDKETGAINEADPPLGIKMLDEIARRGQFEWRNSYGVVDSPVENQTWGGVLSWSVDTYDLNGDWYLRTTERLADGVIFPEKWYDGSLIMVRKKAEIDGDFQFGALLTPFTYGVWILILLTTIASGLVFYAIEYIGSDDKKKMTLSMRESVFQSFLNMTGQFVLDPKEAGNRLVAFSTSVLFLVVLATYTANLASFLVIRNSPDVVINDIQDVIRNDLRVCVLRSSTSETFMRESYETARLVEKEKIVDTYLGLDSGDCDVVLTTIGTWMTKKGDIVYNEDCRKEWVGRVVQAMDAGFSLRDSAELCSSLVRDVFSLHLLEMKRDKTFATIWDSDITVTNNCEDIGDSEEDSDDSAKMSLKNIGSIFIFHFAACLFAVIFTLNLKRRKTNKLRRSEAKFSQSPYSKQNSSSKSMPEAATVAAQLNSAPMNTDNDLHLTEEGVVSFNQNNIKTMACITTIEEQIESMESMKKQMEKIREEFTQSMEEEIE